MKRISNGLAIFMVTLAFAWAGPKNPYPINEVSVNEPQMVAPLQGETLLTTGIRINQYTPEKRSLTDSSVITQKTSVNDVRERPIVFSWQPFDARVKCLQYGTDPSFTQCANISLNGDTNKIATSYALPQDLPEGAYLWRLGWEAGGQMRYSLPWIFHVRAPYKPAYAFDFGTENSPLFEGMQRVTPATIYSQEQGYGWLNSGKLAGSQSEIGSRWTTKATDFNIDLIWSKETAVFAVALSNGNYDVYFMGGATTALPDGFDAPFCRFEVGTGSATAAINIHNVNVFAKRILHQTVTNGEMRIEFRPQQGGWLANGLIIYPAADAARVKETVITPMERIIFQGTRPLPAEAPMRMFPQEYYKDMQGIGVYARSAAHRIFSDTRPASEELLFGNLPVEITVAPGEYEPVSFAVYAFTDLQSIEYSIKPLTNPANSAAAGIDAANFNLREVRELPMMNGNGVNYRKWPVILGPQSRMPLASDKSRHFWSVFHCPSNAGAGVYEGKIQLDIAYPDGSRLSRLVPLKVNVENIRLQDNADVVYGIFYTPPVGFESKDQPVSETAWQNMLDEGRDLRSHGMEMLALDPGPGMIEIRKTDKGLEFAGHWERADKLMQWYRQIGFTNPVPLGLCDYFQSGLASACTAGRGGLAKAPSDIGLGKDYYEAVTRLLEFIRRHGEEAGWPEIWHYPIDESIDTNLTVKVYRAARAAGKTFSTSVGSRVNRFEFGPEVSVRCYGGEDDYNPLTERANAEKLGYQFWIYPNSAIILNDRVSFVRMRYIAGFYAWRVGLQGVCPFQYRSIRPWSSQWDTEGVYPYAPFSVVFRTETGLDPSVCWEGYRAGIVDGKYICTLEAAIKDALRSKDKRVSAAAHEAADWLRDVRNSVPLDMYGPGVEQWLLKNGDILRREMAKRIDHLQALTSGHKK